MKKIKQKYFLGTINLNTEVYISDPLLFCNITQYEAELI